MVATLKQRISTAPTSKQRYRYRKNEPGREFYNTVEWRELRLRIFERDLYTCQYKGCGRLEGNTSRLIAHHKKRHNGNRELFFDETNLETVCKPCHDGPISSEERMGEIKGTWD